MVSLLQYFRGRNEAMPDRTGIILYQSKVTPPVRAVLLTIKALGLEVELREVDLSQGDQLKPEYLKMNPLHTIPTLNDKGFVVFDSHAINAYLVTKYGTDDSLYPKDPEKRAVVDQRLHFDSGILYPRLRELMDPIFHTGELKFADNSTKRALRAYKMLDALIGQNKWVAGSHMTIADFCCVATLSSIEILVPGVEKYPNLSAWLHRCKTYMKGYKEINEEGLNLVSNFLKSRLS